MDGWSAGSCLLQPQPPTPFPSPSPSPLQPGGGQSQVFFIRVYGGFSGSGWRLRELPNPPPPPAEPAQRSGDPGACPPPPPASPAQAEAGRRVRQGPAPAPRPLLPLVIHTETARASLRETKLIIAAFFKSSAGCPLCFCPLSLSLTPPPLSVSKQLALIGSACQCPWCQYSHPGQFQVASVRSWDSVHNQLPQLGERLQLTTTYSLHP